jgi:hypothetical protein
MSRPEGLHIDEARLRPHLRQVDTSTPLHSDRHGSRDTPAVSQRSGNVPTATPAELRGIPVQARGVTGTIPHTNPLTETIYRLTPKERR